MTVNSAEIKPKFVVTNQGFVTPLSQFKKPKIILNYEREQMEEID